MGKPKQRYSLPAPIWRTNMVPSQIHQNYFVYYIGNNWLLARGLYQNYIFDLVDHYKIQRSTAQWPTQTRPTGSDPSSSASSPSASTSPVSSCWPLGFPLACSSISSWYFLLPSPVPPSPPAHASQQGQQLTRPQFIIVALWGLVDFVLLLCKRFHHPGINVALDLIAVLILVIMGVFGTAVFRDIGFTYNDIKALRIGIIVAFFSA